ncbi:ADP-ribosyltransferase [Nocardia thraciensis]
MGIEIPDSLQWVAKWVLGAGDWPDGDETAMRRVADAWSTAATTLGGLDDDAGQVIGQVLAAIDTGQTHDAIGQAWQQLAGKEGALQGLVEYCEKQAELLDDGANDIEHTKLTIIATMVITAAQMAWAVTGVGAVVSAAARTAAQVTIRMAIRALIQRMLSRAGAKAIARAALLEAGKGALEEGGVDLGARLIQVAKGDRSTDKFGLGESIQATVGGAVGGAVGGGLGKSGIGEVADDTAGSAVGRFAGKAVTEAGTELASDVAGQAAASGYGAAFLGQEFKLDLGAESLANAGVGGVHSAATSGGGHSDSGGSSDPSGDAETGAGGNPSGSQSGGSESGSGAPSPTQPSGSTGTQPSSSTGGSSPNDTGTGSQPSNSTGNGAGDTGTGQPSGSTGGSSPNDTGTGSQPPNSTGNGAGDTGTGQPSGSTGGSGATDTGAGSPQSGGSAHGGGPDSSTQSSGSTDSGGAASHSSGSTDSTATQSPSGASGTTPNSGFDTNTGAQPSSSPGSAAGSGFDSSTNTGSPSPGTGPASAESSSPGVPSQGTTPPRTDIPGADLPQGTTPSGTSSTGTSSLDLPPAQSPETTPGSDLPSQGATTPRTPDTSTSSLDLPPTQTTGTNPGADQPSHGATTPRTPDTSTSSLDLPPNQTTGASPHAGTTQGLDLPPHDTAPAPSRPDQTASGPSLDLPAQNSGPATQSTGPGPDLPPHDPTPQPSQPTGGSSLDLPPHDTPASNQPNPPGGQQDSIPAATTSTGQNTGPTATHASSTATDTPTTSSGSPAMSGVASPAGDTGQRSNAPTHTPSTEAPSAGAPVQPRTDTGTPPSRPDAGQRAETPSAPTRSTPETPTSPNRPDTGQPRPEPTRADSTPETGRAPRPGNTTPSSARRLPQRPGFDPAAHRYVARHDDGRLIGYDPFFSGEFNPHIGRYQPTPAEIDAARAHPPGESPDDVEVRRHLEAQRADTTNPNQDEQERSASAPTDASNPAPATPVDPSAPTDSPSRPQDPTDPSRSDSPPRWAHHDPNHHINAARLPEWWPRANAGRSSAENRPTPPNPAPHRPEPQPTDNPQPRPAPGENLTRAPQSQPPTRPVPPNRPTTAASPANPATPPTHRNPTPPATSPTHHNPTPPTTTPPRNNPTPHHVTRGHSAGSSSRPVGMTPGHGATPASPAQHQGPAPEGRIGPDGYRRFDTDSAGERYGENRLGNVYRSLPRELAQAIRLYTRQSMPNGFLRNADPAGSAGRYFNHLLNERHGVGALAALNGGRMPSSVRELANLWNHPGATDVQRAWIRHVLSSPNPGVRLNNLWSNAQQYNFLHGYFGEPPTADAFNRRVAAIDAALAHPLPEPIQAIRGLHDLSFLRAPDGQPLGSRDPRILQGTSQLDRGYMSTTLGANPTVVDGNPFEHRMNLRLPPGTHGLWMGTNSEYPDQRELILPRGTEFRITGVRHVGYAANGTPMFEIDAEVVPHGTPPGPSGQPPTPGADTTVPPGGPGSNTPGANPPSPAPRSNTAGSPPPANGADAATPNQPSRAADPQPAPRDDVAARGESGRPDQDDPGRRDGSDTSTQPETRRPSAHSASTPPSTQPDSSRSAAPSETAHPTGDTETSRPDSPRTAPPAQANPSRQSGPEIVSETTHSDTGQPTPTTTAGVPSEAAPRTRPTEETPNVEPPRNRADQPARPESQGMPAQPRNTTDSESPRPEAARYPGPTPEQREAIRRYTDPDARVYEDLNRRLRDGTELTPDQRRTADDISEGLRNLPPHEGTVWRGLELSAAEIARYVPGETVTEAAFTSTTRDRRMRFGRSVEFVIHSSTGRDISSFSAAPRNESEVLFGRNTTFQVRGVVRDPNMGLTGGTRIYLYETPASTANPDTDSTAQDASEAAAAYEPSGTTEQQVLHGNDRTAIGNDPQAQRVFQNLRNEGHHDVIVHGNRFGRPVPGNEHEIDPQQIVDAIRSNPNYVEGTPVRLIACHSGNDIGWAQRVADELGVPVTAPTDAVGVRQRPDSPAMVHDGGQWSTFHPTTADGATPDPTRHTPPPTSDQDGPHKTTEGQREGWDIMDSESEPEPRRQLTDSDLPDDLPPDKRAAILRIYAEAEQNNVEIRSGEEAERYLDWVAARSDDESDSFLAVTMGDLIMVRESVQFDTRTLGEELIHAGQQMSGRSDIFECEIEARETLLAEPEKYALTSEEVSEIEHELRTMRERGYY